MERQIGKFIFAGNSPFKLVENKEFVALMELVRPGIKLPDRKEVGAGF